MNGPPSSGQVVRAGRRSRRTSPVHHLRHRSAPPPAQPDAEQLGPDVAGAPQPGRRGGHQGLRQLGEPPDQPPGPLAERQLGPARGAEEVGDDRIIGVRDVGEQQRGPARGDHPPVDLGRLERALDRGRLSEPGPDRVEDDRGTRADRGTTWLGVELRAAQPCRQGRRCGHGVTRDGDGNHPADPERRNHRRRPASGCRGHLSMASLPDRPAAIAACDRRRRPNRAGVGGHPARRPRCCAGRRRPARRASPAAPLPARSTRQDIRPTAQTPAARRPKPLRSRWPGCPTPAPGTGTRPGDGKTAVTTAEPSGASSSDVRATPVAPRICVHVTVTRSTGVRRGRLRAET